ncbi:nucleotidyltransferase domain-containing protein [Sporolactobacillus pectinivorans]|uniref:nucleotidyltransferase domain-containing protein n=1 Tax=Sporolactobacillus pectinivorans TaxID=1591408 RepID=UPI000C25A8D1|nr:nucleotidyltransferase domain-containing protein [Sporolactobacillus pectinivorans]
MIDLSFIKSIAHRCLVAEIYDEAVQDGEIIGLLLQGSVARGENYQTSDIDFYVLLEDGLNRPLCSEYRGNILVEMKYADFERAVYKCKSSSMGLYNFLDSIILFDYRRKFSQIKELANNVLEQYEVPKSEVKSIVYWLETALIKIEAAREADDELKAAFVVATTSWKILEGLWAVNSKPVPPNGLVFYHLKKLKRVPENVDEEIKLLFTGDTTQRIETAIRIIEWTISCLNRLSRSA